MEEEGGLRGMKGRVQRGGCEGEGAKKREGRKTAKTETDGQGSF